MPPSELTLNWLEPAARRVENTLDRLLPGEEGPAETLARAMRYAVFAGGKRLRPALVLGACEACGGRPEDVDEPAAAIEMIHTYSLVHDDLPAMDDDDLRRGRPTVHVAFGEAEAILAGDALLTLAFEVLSTAPPGPEAASRRTAAVAAAARGAGAGGMVGGQIADLEAEGRPPDAARLEWIHGRKTGALISAAARIGAIHAGASDEIQNSLARYGAELGLAFQIADDILDETSTRAEIGKTPGKDRRAGKASYSALLGIDAARAEANRHAARAIDLLDRAGLRSEPLRSLARFAAARSR